MDGYISKPIRPQELDEMLDRFTSGGHEVAAQESTPKDDVDTVSADELLERIGGDRELLAEWVELFREDYPLQLARARAALEIGDAVALGRVGHTLRGALGNLAAPNASRMACDLELIGETGEPGFARVKIEGLEHELARVCAALESLCLETVK